jgi:hypothetical protein
MRIVGATSGMGPGTVTLQVDPASSTARSTGIAVATPQGAAVMLISQAVSPASTDTLAPVMGRVRATNTKTGTIELSWDAARDSQTGVSSYQVVYQQGLHPPSRTCTTGMQVQQAPVVSGYTVKMVVSGLTPGARYAFRVCALDAAGNVAGGRVWAAIAKP